MKFGEKGIKTCVTCGKEFEGHVASKYCSDACKPQNRKHRKKEPKVVVENGNLNNNLDNVNVVDSGGISDDIVTTNEPNEPIKTDVQQHSGLPESKTEINSIQIIDSNTGKKEKGIIDQIFEKAFSEEFAPITTSLLGALAARLQQPNNATEDGMLTAEDGSKHAMI